MNTIEKEEFWVLDDPRFDLHSPDGDIPEKPARTAGIRMILSDFPHIEPTPITKEELSEIHKAHYVSHVLRQCRRAINDYSIKWVQDNLELPLQAGSMWALLAAAGGVQAAVRMVLDSESPISRVFCNSRPPGHHAFPGKGMGFCFFNNVWIGAVSALKSNPKARVLIVDWDVHHGNGTQAFVQKSQYKDRVLFINTQQSYKTLWPKTGKPTRRGSASHNSYISYNYAVGGGDAAVKKLWKESLLLDAKEFDPTLIMISCGFDAHVADPLGGLCFSSEIYGWMTKKLRQVCPQIVSVLEGGYDVPAIVEATEAHISELI